MLDLCLYLYAPREVGGLLVHCANCRAVQEYFEARKINHRIRFLDPTGQPDDWDKDLLAMADAGNKALWFNGAKYALDTHASLPRPQGPFAAYLSTGEIIPFDELMEIVSAAKPAVTLAG